MDSNIEEYINLTPDQAILLSDVINGLKEIIVNCRYDYLGKVLGRKMHAKDAKKRKRDGNIRLHRLGISFSENEILELKEKAKELKLKVAEYCYLKIFGRTIRFSEPSNTALLHKLSLKVEHINNIAKSLNTFLELSDSEKKELLEIIQNIYNLLNG